MNFFCDFIFYSLEVHIQEYDEQHFSMFQLAVISLVLRVISGAPTSNQYSGATKFDAESKTQRVLRLPILKRRTDRCDASQKTSGSDCSSPIRRSVRARVHVCRSSN